MLPSFDHHADLGESYVPNFILVDVIEDYARQHQLNERRERMAIVNKMASDVAFMAATVVRMNDELTLDEDEG